MSRRAIFWMTIVVTVAGFSQAACYNRYFITKDELGKLQSGVEVRRVVEVRADCPESDSSKTEGEKEKSALGPADRRKLAASAEGAEETTAGAAPTRNRSQNESKEDKEGNSGGSGGGAGAKAGAACTSVPVSTANAINVVLKNGAERRVTPFNFMMSSEQLVSPEYDLLLSLDRVKGAEVREFSTWKTVVTIASVTVGSVGTFVALSLTSDNPSF